MYKQIIIARKDLNLSPGKLAVQVSHGSMAFLTSMIAGRTYRKLDNYYEAWGYDNEGNKRAQHYRRDDLNDWAIEARGQGKNGFYAKPVDETRPYGKLELCDPCYHYETKIRIDNDTYEQWIKESFTKVVLEAKNKNQLLKAKVMAEGLGMKEWKDFFCIYDCCRTELEPEEPDGSTLTVIGFRPMDGDTIDAIAKKYHLYT